MFDFSTRESIINSNDNIKNLKKWVLEKTQSYHNKVYRVLSEDDVKCRHNRCIRTKSHECKGNETNQRDIWHSVLSASSKRDLV